MPFSLDQHISTPLIPEFAERKLAKGVNSNSHETHEMSNIINFHRHLENTAKKYAY